MKWLEITITTAPPALEAIADLLRESRSPGIEELSAGAETVRLRAYLPLGPTTGVTLDAIRARVSVLPGFGLDVGPATIETAEVDDEGWAEAWKAHFRPFAVGRLWITPSWDRAAPPAGAVVIELDPGMAFGSGLHPSTRMCLEVLEQRFRPGDAVLDVGTGSGILSIAAAKLGASRVLAIDADPVAVAVAKTNVAHNDVAALVRVQEGDLLTGVHDAADMVLANLTADLHLTFLPMARPYLAPGGMLAASGITENREQEVEAAARAAGLAAVQTLRSGEWRCFVLAAAGLSVPMSLRRFVVPPDAITADAVVLRGSEAHHAAVVLRLRPGECVVVVDGSGLERVVELTSVSPGETTGRVLETRRGMPHRVELMLIQGVPKAAKMDDIVRMGTELGVAEVIPVLTRRTVAEGRGRAARWRRIGAAAAKQSRRADVPVVRDPQPLAEALDRLPPDTLLIVLWEGERAHAITSALRRDPRPGRVAVLVGPEGGLDEDDVRLAVERGGVPVTLGPLILRTETAGIVALAMVLYELGLRE